MMKNVRTFVWVAALMTATTQPCHAQLVINELMQSNVDCVMDDLNEFPDSWVELYNAGTAPVNLSQYRLGDSEQASNAWQLPSMTVAAGQRVLVYCDKEATGLHTDFRLESGKGCAVYLFQGTTVVDQVTGLKKQPAPNIAYGRQTDGVDKWGYQATPTPGQSNCGQTCKDVLGDVVFSTEGKVVIDNTPLKLALTMPEGTPEGTVIRFTTDGSEPTQLSTRYTAPIDIAKTRTIRAKAFCDNWLSPPSVTHSYIFFPRQLTLPVVSIVTDKRYLEDSKIGIYVDGDYSSNKKNYEYDWRRPLNVEFFFDGADTPSNINQLCEFRIMGGATRSNKFKSLALYANKRFGTKRFNYEFFPDQRPGLTDYKSVALRNAGNDFDYLYMRDAIIQRSMAERQDLDWQAWRPAIVYINGEYKGMLNIRERSNEDNIYTNYDGLEDVDMVENWYELKEGSMDHFNRFKDFYAEHGHTMAEYEQWLDCREFMNVMIMNLYYNNQDFPGNNIVFWRPRQDGGRWRVIAKDTDFGLGLYGSKADYKTIEWLHNPNYDSERAWANGYEHTRLFRRLMEDEDFKREFIDRAAIYMGDFMNARGTHEIWDPMYEMIKYEYPFHRKLINEWWPNYNNEMSFVNTWLNNRTASFYNQLADYYKLGMPLTLLVNRNLKEDDLKDIDISMNGVKLTKGIFDGRFFAERAVTLKGTGKGNSMVTGWKVIRNGTTEVMDGDTYSFNMMTSGSMIVEAIIEKTNGIVNVADNGLQWRIDDGQLLVSGVDKGRSVSLYDSRGILLFQGHSQDKQMAIPVQKGQIYILKVGEKRLKIKN